MFMEKSPYATLCSIRPGGLENPYLISWNFPPGIPEFRRHNGGMTSAAADGHAEELRMPVYQPGQPPPSTFVELGDCANSMNPGSHGVWINNGPRAKLFCRFASVPIAENPF